MIEPSNMKSELLGTDADKPGSGQPAERRLTNVTTPVINGDDLRLGEKKDWESNSEVNLVAAIQDHMSCTKSSAELLVKPQDRIVDEKIALSYELDHMYANCSEAKAARAVDPATVKHLKELLLAHLDLIQQQQQQLIANDKEIGSLRKENETLRQRISRLEKGGAARITTEHDLKRQCTLPDSTKGTLSGVDAAGSFIGKRVRTTHHFAESHHKRNDSCDGQSGPDCSLSPSLEDASKCSSPQATRRGTLLKSSTKQSLSSQKKENILRTDMMYYTTVGEIQRIPDSPSGEDEVIVPSWRVRPVSYSYTMEGTENLDDEVFLKRHQKLEIDERRRKRWDVQRIREQRLQEKLKKGRYANKGVQDDDSELSTLHPRPEDALYIEVDDTVPVSAFGTPIPYLEPCEFSLPWPIKGGKVLRGSDTRRGT